MIKYLLTGLVIISSTQALPALAAEKYIMLVDQDLKAMLYKRGLLMNSWKPYKVDGFVLGNETMSFSDFAEVSYVADKTKLWRVEGHLGTKTNRVCRMYPRSTYEGERLQFYVGEGDARRYIVFDDREDYLKFRCQKQ